LAELALAVDELKNEHAQHAAELDDLKTQHTKQIDALNVLTVQHAHHVNELEAAKAEQTRHAEWASAELARVDKKIEQSVAHKNWESTCNGNPLASIGAWRNLDDAVARTDAAVASFERLVNPDHADSQVGVADGTTQNSSAAQIDVQPDDTTPSMLQLNQWSASPTSSAADVLPWSTSNDDAGISHRERVSAQLQEATKRRDLLHRSMEGVLSQIPHATSEKQQELEKKLQEQSENLAALDSLKMELTSLLGLLDSEELLP
jgi:hypothetical protein